MLKEHVALSFLVLFNGSQSHDIFIPGELGVYNSFTCAPKKWFSDFFLISAHSLGIVQVMFYSGRIVKSVPQKDITIFILIVLK